MPISDDQTAFDAGALSEAKELKRGADGAAAQVRNLYITFLLAGVYTAVVVGSTTDLQLFKVSPVRLPILDVGLPIVAFYTLIPWLILLLQFSISSNGGALRLALTDRRLGVLSALAPDVAGCAHHPARRFRLLPPPHAVLVRAPQRRLHRRLGQDHAMW